MTTRLPILAVSVGCPSGIGPEVSVVGATRVTSPVLLVGDLEVILRAADARGVTRQRIFKLKDPSQARLVPKGGIAVWQPGESLAARDVKPGKPSRAGGAAQLAWIDAATDLVVSGGAGALVTGPVSKEVIAGSGAPGAREFLGHTEHLQRRLGAKEVVMGFWSPGLTCTLATTHLALRDVPDAITKTSVARAAYWLARLLWNLDGASMRPAVVASLNPHAGEGELLGREERLCITPGIELARARLAKDKIRAKIVGPIGAETAFRMTSLGWYGGVVAMYHDQATIPMKLTGFGSAVNVSLGLPIVRTSVDHGTAYDRAREFNAEPFGMENALKLAARLAKKSRSASGPQRRKKA